MPLTEGQGPFNRMSVAVFANVTSRKWHGDLTMVDTVLFLWEISIRLHLSTKSHTWTHQRAHIMDNSIHTHVCMVHRCILCSREQRNMLTKGCMTRGPRHDILLYILPDTTIYFHGVVFPCAMPSHPVRIQTHFHRGTDPLHHCLLRCDRSSTTLQ